MDVSSRKRACIEALNLSLSLCSWEIRPCNALAAAPVLLLLALWRRCSACIELLHAALLMRVFAVLAAAVEVLVPVAWRWSPLLFLRRLWASSLWPVTGILTARLLACPCCVGARDRKEKIYAREFRRDGVAVSRNSDSPLILVSGARLLLLPGSHHTS
jgi:hypothetical protein